MSEHEARYENLRAAFATIGPVRLLGMRIAELSPGHAVVVLETHADLLHDFGVHGGVLAMVADTAAAAALYTEIPMETPMATVEMKINFLTPHRGGELRAVGKVLKRGKRLAVAEAELAGPDGKKVAKSLLTFSLLAAEDRE